MREVETNSSLEMQWKNWRSLHTSGSNARETAYEIIRQNIINLTFKPGEPLSDKLLAEELNMSRTPVREALILLASTNMVILKPQIGTFVAPIDFERMEMEQFARFSLEKEIVTQACPKVTDEYKWRYEDNLRNFDHYCGMSFPGRNSRLLELDNEFHRIAFIIAGRDDNFFHMLNNMQHVERMRMLSLEGLDQKRVYDEHENISSAIIAGDLQTALYWIELHFNKYKDNMAILQEKFPEYFSLGR
jgi:DNA-binding GntR family transcriptional regulator